MNCSIFTYELSFIIVEPDNTLVSRCDHCYTQISWKPQVIHEVTKQMYYSAFDKEYNYLSGYSADQVFKYEKEREMITKYIEASKKLSSYLTIG